MNDQEELGRRIARLLDHGADAISAEERTRLIEARRLAVSRHAAQPERGLVPAVVDGFSTWTEQSVLGVRYLVPIAALVLGLIGAVYVHTGGVQSEIADIDAKLLADELPINAYLDQGFDAWLKRSLR